MEFHNRWPEVKTLLEEALEQPAYKRADFIASSCSDPAIRADALRLLNDVRTGSDFFLPRPDSIAREIFHETLNPRLTCGDVLADQFTIQRLLGQGGIGEVYEAIDLHGQTRVALKILRRASVDQPVLSRLVDELILSRAVTHVNVCRIFALHLHAGSAAVSDETLFLTMELIQGETLSDRVDRAGALTASEILEMARQLAAALAAVHDAGVAHGDLKPSNVMLSSLTDGNLRTVLMDFGISVSSPASSSAPGGTGPRAGTPGYVAPEQHLTGATPVADVYSFGVIMRRLMAAHGNSPNRFPRWFRSLVDRCLCAKSEERFQDGRQLLKQIEHVTDLTQRPALLVAAATLLLVFLIFGLRYISHGPTERRLAIAVLAFNNEDRELRNDYLSELLAYAVDADLAIDNSVRVIPAADVDRAQAELGIGNAWELPAEALARLRAALGADLIVLGSFSLSALSGTVRVDASVRDTRSGRTIATIFSEDSERKIGALGSRTAALLRQRLHLANLPTAEEESLRAALPGSLEAMRLYGEGLQRLRKHDALGARELLERAVASEPDYPEAHSALSQTWTVTGYDARAKDEAALAFRLRSHLPATERLLIEARYHETLHEDRKAADSYGQLLKLSPDNPDYLLLLANVQNSDEALKTIAALRNLPSPVRDDPRIDLAEAEAANSADQYQREQSAARRAAAKALAVGATSLVVDARLHEGWSSRLLGQPDQATKAYSDAWRLSVALKDDLATGRALRGLALVAQFNGNVAGAAGLYVNALAVFRRLGSLGYVATAQNGLAMIASAQGRLDDALQEYSDTLKICQETRDPICSGRAFNNIGSVLFFKGDTIHARLQLDAALQAFEEGHGRYGKTFVLSSLADLLATEGRLAEAEKNARESLALSQNLGDRSSVASTGISLAAILLDRGDLAEARRVCESALQQDLALNAQGASANARVLHARIALRQNRPLAAESDVRQALPHLAHSQRHDDEAVAKGVLAEALAETGRTSEALKTSDEAVNSMATGQNRLARISVLLSAGRVQSRAGDKSRAKAYLESALGLAGKSGYTLLADQASREMARLH